MIKQTIYYALAANFIWMLPHYQRLIRKRTREVVLRETVGQHEYDDALTCYDDDEVRYRSMPMPMKSGEIMTAEYVRANKRYMFYKEVSSNPFHRKPFTCMYCMSFWVSILLTAVVNDLPHSLDEFYMLILIVIGSTVLSVMLNRWYESLTISF